jgi:outer membrane lipoprotein-sorting protein
MGVSMFRRLSSRGLVLLIGSVSAFAAVAAVVAVTAFGGGGSAPPAEPLSQAIGDALSAPPVAGVTARISFSNDLLGSSALGSLAGSSGSALLSGASGRLWLTSDGHLRLELQSDSGDTQIVSDGTTLTVYDASSNTAYELALPAPTSPPPTAQNPPPASEIDAALAQLAAVADVSGAVPGSIAGQPAYTVTLSPKDNGGLVGSVELGFDAATGVPLHAAIYARGDSTPVLDLTATDVSYGPVASSDVDITPPPGARIVTLSLPTSGASEPNASPVTGVGAVAAALSFTLAAPDSLDGLPRSEVRLIGSGAGAGALVTYGQGLGTIVVREEAAAAGGDSSSPFGALPSVAINGATGHELVTALGTVVQYTSGGVSYTLAGSVSQSDAETAARALTS